MPASQSFLLKIQIGPVQDFIAQARSTRDLWSGSYLLSWLVAAGINNLPTGHKLIFPARDNQPLLNRPLDPAAKNLLIPNLPNIFIAEVFDQAEQAAVRVCEEINSEWLRIATAVWIHPKRKDVGIRDTEHVRFFDQVRRHLSVSWQITPVTEETADAYWHAYQHSGWRLDAVRQTRNFAAWLPGEGLTDKDSLSGKEEAVFQGSGRPVSHEVWQRLLHKHSDHLGAIAIIKRVWHLAYLKETHHFLTASNEFRIRSIPAIAARKAELDDNAPPQEKSGGDNYIAVIAFDGDSIGKWVNGDNSPSNINLRQHHTNFSNALSEFAMRRVPGTVESNDGWLGQLVYAGGDDVLCLVPADAALSVASLLRRAFREETAGTPSSKETPDASVGIAIAHIHAPLQDLIREAQKAEKRAKNEVGRPAFSITLMKRSGEITHWGSKWSTGGLELSQAIAERIRPGGLSAKFPHRVCELLSPYLIQQTGLTKEKNTITDAITDDVTAKDLILREFSHVAMRQGSKTLSAELEQPLKEYLDGLLVARAEREERGKPSAQSVAQELLTSLIGLCTTVAFAHRTKSEPAEMQTPAHA